MMVVMVVVVAGCGRDGWESGRCGRRGAGAGHGRDGAFGVSALGAVGYASRRRCAGFGTGWAHTTAVEELHPC